MKIMATRSYSWYMEVLPVVALVTVECTNVGSITLFKAASMKGLSYHVYMVYFFAISTLYLLILSCIFYRKTKLPPPGIPMMLRTSFLGVMGFTGQMLGNKGIEYASPTLGSAMSNITPAFTFALAVIFRMEKLELKKLSSQAKIMGAIMSISGALVVVFYKGPTVIKIISKSNSLPLLAPSSSTQSSWIIGGGLLASEYTLMAIWYILQVKNVNEYPAELIVVFFLQLTSTIVSVLVCLIMEPNFNAWKINNDVSWVAILYAGIIGSSGIIVQLWALHMRGPVYVALFRPLSIAIAAFMGVIMLGDSLYLGMVLGAIIISAGFYIAMWAKIQEDENDNDKIYNQESYEAPLLQGAS